MLWRQIPKYPSVCLNLLCPDGHSALGHDCPEFLFRDEAVTVLVKDLIKEMKIIAKLFTLINSSVFKMRNLYREGLLDGIFGVFVRFGLSHGSKKFREVDGSGIVGIHCESQLWT